MPNLTYLNVSQNALKGTLPLSYANLSSMQFLDLSGNNLTGELAHGDKSDLLHHGVRMLSIHFCCPQAAEGRRTTCLVMQGHSRSLGRACGTSHNSTFLRTCSRAPFQSLGPQ
jgi:hypothetical protein